MRFSNVRIDETHISNKNIDYDLSYVILLPFLGSCEDTHNIQSSNFNCPVLHIFIYFNRFNYASQSKRELSYIIYKYKVIKKSHQYTVCIYLYIFT